MDATLVLVLQATLGFVASLLLYSFWSLKTINHGDNKKIQAPRAKGAWPIVGHLPLLALAGTEACRTLADMAEEYGPVFRIQLGLKRVLVVSSKEAVMQTTNDISFLGWPDVLHWKGGFYGGFYALSPHGPFWQKMRKISYREFLSNSRVEFYKPLRASEMTTCISELYSLCCKDGNVVPAKLNIGKWFQQVFFNMNRDIIDVMISLFEESDGFIYGYTTDVVLKTTISGVIIAGTDTNYATITWALALILKNKGVLQRAQEELDFHVGRERRVEESDIKILLYLQAILKELNIRPTNPVGPLSIPREALHDTTVSGHHVPKGTMLLVNIWKLHRDPGTWIGLHEFQPERFLTTHAGFDIKSQQYELIPFSAGKRSCPGMAISLQMQLLILARLLQGFNLATPTNEPIDMTAAPGVSMHRKYPLEVVITPRLPNKLYN